MSVLSDNYEQALIVNRVLNERRRQDQLWGKQHHDDGTSFETWHAFTVAQKKMNDKNAAEHTPNWRSILLEEVYEALEEDSDQELLESELTQVAAVCLAWLEDIDWRKRQ